MSRDQKQLNQFHPRSCLTVSPLRCRVVIHSLVDANKQRPKS